MAATKVLLCRCAVHGCLPEAAVAQVEDALSKSESIDLTLVDDLCAVIAARGLDEMPDQVVACHPRAVTWLIGRHSKCAELSAGQLHDLRDEAVEDVLSRLGVVSVPVGDRTATPKKEDAGEDIGTAWFPVLDYDRCTHCAQCMNFCLFEVFGREPNGKMIVERPENCKDNCPACARICPEVAIIFPKTPDSPINGGLIVDELLEREKAQIALQQTGGAGIHAVLRDRRRGGLLKPEARKRLGIAPQDDTDSTG